MGMTVGGEGGNPSDNFLLELENGTGALELENGLGALELENGP